MKLGEIRNILGSEERSTGSRADLSEREPLGYSIDSRSLRTGDLFFAIKGENYDGHRFVEEAIHRGALGAVVSNEFASALRDAAAGSQALVLPVADTLAALQAIAASVRRSWAGSEVAITGSAGKTSTKELTAAALAGTGRVN